MDSQKIGKWMKELRREKGLTQEQMAERFCVSRRTVSRWETGSNLPDLSILVELADFFEVELRELLDGGRETERMDRKLEQTVRKVADYSEEQRKRWLKRLHGFFLFGVFVGIVDLVLLIQDLETSVWAGLCQGILFGMIIVGAWMTSKHADTIRAWKWRILHRGKHNSGE